MLMIGLMIITENMNGFYQFLFYVQYVPAATLCAAADAAIDVCAKEI